MTKVEQLERILNFLLIQYGLNNCYRLEKIQGDLVVRKSTSNEPSPNQRILFEQTVLPIVQPLCKIEPSVVLMGNTPVRLRKMVDINEEALNKKYDELFPLPPRHPNINQKNWDRIPRDVKENWETFDAVMQNYIHQCVKHFINPEQYSEKELGEQYMSPINMEIPNLPVQFPDDKGTERVYDLHTEILKLPVGNDGKIENPVTRGRCTLEEIMPPPIKLVEDLRTKADQLVKKEMQENPMKTFGKNAGNVFK